MSATRTAHCQCGALKVEARGEPDSVVICSCEACQRRSGSPFGAGAYFNAANLTISSAGKEFVRAGVSGKPFRSFFCETCGSSVYWVSDRDRQRIGVALGAFADPHFAKPQRSVFEITKHDWLALPEDIPGFIEGRDSERAR